MLLVAPGIATRNPDIATSSFLLLVAMPGAPILVPSSDAMLLHVTTMRRTFTAEHRLCETRVQFEPATLRKWLDMYLN